MKLYPEPIVGAFIQNEKGEILLVRSYKWGGKAWTVPGGHVEVGETIAQALKREAKEEVGLTVDDIGIFAVFDAISPKLFFKKRHFIFFECQCTTKKPEDLRIDNKEIQEAQWFSLNQALTLELESFARRALTLLQKHVPEVTYL